MDDMLAAIDELLPEGWERDSEVYGLDFNLICPHGRTLEQDGYHTVTADEADSRGDIGTRCESPMRTAGLI